MTPFLRRATLSSAALTLLFTPTIHAAGFDPGSPAVLEAYVGEATAEKLDAALSGLLAVIGGGSSSGCCSGGIDFSGSNGSFHYFVPVRDITVSTTLNAGADSDLGAPGAPLLLNGTLLNVTADFASARAITVGVDGTRIDTYDHTLTLSGDITANGVFIVNAMTGAVVVTGNNTWSVAPYVGTGTLRGNATSLDTDVELYAGSGIVEFNQSADAVYSHVVKGGGTVLKTGAATLTLTGTTDRANSTRIEAGRIVLGEAGRIGEGDLHVGAGTELDAAAARVNGSPFTLAVDVLSGAGLITLGPNALAVHAGGDFGGEIAGSSVLLVSNAELVLSGVNTYTGSTLVYSRLTLTGNGSLSPQSGLALYDAVFDISGANGDRTVADLDGSGAIVLGANRLTFGGDAFYEFSGNISGSGGITKAGSGTTLLSGTNYTTGQTRVLGGTLLAPPRALSADVLDEATLEFHYDANDASGSAIAAYSGTIHGSGKVVKSGTGAVWLRGANTYSGGTEVRAGALVGNTESLQGDIANEAIAGFYQVADGSYGGTVSGTGLLVKYGPGRVTLTGTNTHNGGTSFSGPLAIASDANLGAALAPLTAVDGTLVLEGALTSARPMIWTGTNDVLDDGGYAATVSDLRGDATLTKYGAGELGVDGVQPFSGRLVIAAGTLRLNGGLAGALTIGSGATLAGSGRLGGNLAFAAGSRYAVAVDASGAGSQVTADGTATIAGGAIEVTAAPGSYGARTRYTLVAAAQGLSGAFDSATTDLAFYDPLLSYDATHAYLTLAQRDVGFTSFAGSGQQPLAAALDALAHNGSVDARNANNDLRALTSGEIPTALRQLSGAALPVARLGAGAAQRQVTRLIGARLHGSAGGGTDVAMAAAAADAPLLAANGDGAAPVLYAAMQAAAALPAQAREGFWLRGLGGRGEYDVAAAQALKTRTEGVFGGYDRRLSTHLLLGGYAGYTRSRLDVNDPDLGTDQTLTAWHLGIYSRCESGPVYGDAHFAYGRDATNSARALTVGTLARTARAKIDADTYDAALEFGYSFALPWGLTPFAGLKWTRQDTGAFRESGAGALDLAVRASADDALRSRLGLRLSTDTASARFGAELQAAWTHQYLGRSRFAARLEGDLTQTLFTVASPATPRDGAELGAELRLRFGKGTQAFAGVDAEVSPAYYDYALSAGIRMSW